MKKIIISTLLLLTISCIHEKPKYSKIERDYLFKNGEWIGEEDSTSGLSIKKNMIAEFNHMIVPMENVYNYTIIDSIKQINQSKEVYKSYIRRASEYKDTLYNELIKSDSIAFIIKEKGIEKKYTLLTKEEQKIRDSIRKNRISKHATFVDSICNKEQEICFKYSVNKYLTSEFDHSIVYQVKKSFDTTIEFTLSKTGEIKNIKTDTPSRLVNNEIIKLFNELPQITPNEYKGNKISVIYSIPLKYNRTGKENNVSQSFSIGHLYIEKVSKI